MFLLDTNICVPLINGSDRTLASKLLERSPADVVLCSVVVAELHFGVRNSDRVAENLDRLTRFCAEMESLPFEDDAALHYGVIRAQLQREGRPIGANDLMIAATALNAKATLVTRNTSEFHRVPGLRVEEW